MPDPAQHLHNLPPIDELDEVTSTNAIALARAAHGERGPVWLRANRQVQGRGRAGRSWSTEPGDLAATLLLAPDCVPANLHQLALVAGLAAHATVMTLARDHRKPVDLKLKWPNDLMIGGAKLGGILIESSTFGGTLVACIGIGINLKNAPAIPGRSVACLSDHLGAAIEPREVMILLRLQMARALRDWAGGRAFTGICERWLQQAQPIGEPMSIHTGQNSAPVTGTFQGLDTDGALCLRENSGALRRFTFGDVSLETKPN